MKSEGLIQAGFFWTPEPPKQPEAKRVPPAPVWLDPSYLPGLEEARRFNVPLMTQADLEEAARVKDVLIFDIEEYQNYLLVAFVNYRTGGVVYVERRAGDLELQGEDLLWWILGNFQIVSFNGVKFDIPILTLILAGKSCSEIYHAAGMLIGLEMLPWQVLQSFKVDPIECDHIDLIEVCPLSASLKIYGGRLHVPKMQDLPFKPETVLSEDQITILRFYCINDLATTCYINFALAKQIAVRVEMSAKYGIDLRSKSDAQVAEAVIKAELEKLTGFRIYRPEIPPGTGYVYNVPAFLKFKSPAMLEAVAKIQRAVFTVADTGAIGMPPELEALEVKIGAGVYRMGIGGLHSSETCAAHRADDRFKIVDRDVTSYYPSIILNQGLFPAHLGTDFVTIYRSLVERRIAAKRSGNKVEADMLKIVINGSFGKFGSKWSILYSPDLLIQTTITGQLSLLMLIEALELSGVQVISANTDGIVMKYPRDFEGIVALVVKEWEQATNFETEETEYIGLFSRDVNNYVAIKPGGKVKGKGEFFNPWEDPDLAIFRFHKNPETTICIEAVCNFLTSGTPISETVRACRDIRKFVAVRNVKGGGVKDGVFLGKAVRWYYPINGGGEIVYAISGNKVPKSDGARPLMELPAEFPDDVDFSRYEAEAFEMLQSIGAV